MTPANLSRWALGACAGLLLSALVVVQSGCVVVAAGAAGAGTVAYVRGEMAASLDQSLERAVRATQRAIEQLQFAKVSEKKDALVAVLIARTAEDKKIEIRISAVGETQSKVQIRVGLIGDQALSLRVLDQIKSNL